MRKFIIGLCWAVAFLVLASVALILFPPQQGKPEPPEPAGPSKVNYEWYKTYRDYQRERKDK